MQHFLHVLHVLLRCYYVFRWLLLSDLSCIGLLLSVLDTQSLILLWLLFRTFCKVSHSFSQLYQSVRLPCALSPSAAPKINTHSEHSLHESLTARFSREWMERVRSGLASHPMMLMSLRDHLISTRTDNSFIQPSLQISSPDPLT